jgi:hypothetical protein
MYFEAPELSGRRHEIKFKRLFEAAMKSLQRGSALTCLVLAALASSASAQTSNATLNGTVHDSSGAALIGATVTATNTATREQKQAITDDAGRYTIVSLLPGFYDVQAERTGFATTLRRNQELLVGTTITLDIALPVSSVNQTVEVQAGEVTLELDTTENTIQRVLESREVDNLPLITRSFSDLAALTPGVIVGVGTVSTANISINNNPVGETGYILDGHSNENDFFGGQFVNVAQDWIQEFSVLTDQFPAEYGNAAGGIVNAVSRSGTNELHGRAYGFFQDAALNATPSFLPSFAPEKPPYSSQRVGGMLGGPVKKDKVFYFAGFEYYKNTTCIPIVVPAAFSAVPGSSGVFPQTNSSNLAIFKIDYQANSNNAFNLRSNLEYDNALNTGIGAAGSFVHVLGNSTDGFTPNYDESASWTRTLSANAINELYFLFQKDGAGSTCNYASEVGPYTGGGANATPFGNPVGYWAQVTYASAGVVTGCGVAFGNMDQANGKLGDQFTYTKGSHTVKIGVEFDREHIYTNQFHNNYDGQYVVAGGQPFTPGIASTYPLTLYSFYQPIGNTSWDFPTWEDSLFAQDSWRITPRLTLNIGLRYDVSFSNSEFSSEGFTPNNSQGHKINNDYGDIAPRFGFAWTPFRDERNTVIRGGLGLYYDQDHLQTASAYITGFSKITNGFNLNATRPLLNPYCYAVPSPCSSSVPAVYASAVEEVLAYALANYSLPNFNPPGGTITLGTSTYSIPALPLVPGLNGASVNAPTNFVFNVNQNFKVPADFQGSIGVQHQFDNSLSVSADFAYSRLYNGILLEDSNVNPTTYGLLDPNYIIVESFGNGTSVWAKHLLLHAGYNDHRGDTIQGSYTFGYATDNAIGGFITGSHTQMVTDPFNYNLDKGPSPTDARHNLAVSSLVRVPWGVEFTPIVYFTSALPYSATTTQTTPGCQYFYTACYPVGYTRDSLRGDDTFSFNARVSKAFRLGERYSIEGFFEAFNITNKLNTGTNFQGSVLSPHFEQPTGQASARRQLQLGGRFNF